MRAAGIQPSQHGLPETSLSALSPKGGDFLPACSGELQGSTTACVLVWIYFRGFVFVVFENGQGVLEQSGLNVCGSLLILLELKIMHT